MHMIWLLIGVLCVVCCISIEDDQEYDFIVVGVGSAGSIMAARLSEPDHNWTVLGLDRGNKTDSINPETYEMNPSSIYDTNYFSIPQDYLLGRVVRNPRFYGLGGAAIVNGMIAIAPSRNLLDKLWPTGWKWDDLLPYMIKMQNHYCYYLPSSITGISDEDCRKWHGQNGPLDIAPPLFEQMSEEFLDLMKECNETIGFTSDYDNPNKQSGCYFHQKFRKPFNKTDPNSESVRASTWSAYIKGTNRTNLQIVDSATVLKLVFDQNEPTKCIGVEYEYEGQKYTAKAKKEVILSAGVFDTPKLLQLSGVGPREWIEPFKIKVVTDNPHVGMNFVDQMALFMAFETTQQVPQTPWDVTTCGWLLNSELKESNITWPNIQILCYSTYLRLTFDQIIVGLDPIAYAQPPIPFVTFLIYYTFPHASGTVKIQSLSPYVQPQIDHNWHNLSDIDQNNLQYAVHFVRNITKNTRWGRKYIKRELFPGQRFEGSDDLHRRLNLCSVYHQAGTCGIGTCTDNQAHVLGIQNVRVSDMSLFTTQVNVNPTYTLYSITEKIADLIKKQYSHD